VARCFCGTAAVSADAYAPRARDDEQERTSKRLLLLDLHDIVRTRTCGTP
jgi:hypothetical protein